MSKRLYIDLINKLSDDDKQTLENYIYNYGVKKEGFIGLNKWLQPWSHSNQILFQLLGDQLIYEVPLSYEKSQTELISNIETELFTMPFRKSFHDFYYDRIYDLWNKNIIDSDTKIAFSSLFNTYDFIANKTAKTIKLKLPNKKLLQIQAGTKTLKAFSKIINYFDDYDFVGFEEFRIKHSIILTDKKFKGKLCISIHPMDFITMSDNDSNWSSCMSWTSNGCYHAGTIEMMNSNNVVCCYLVDDDERDDKFDFRSSKKWDNPEDHYTWNNKKWRILGYINKDIIMTGKAYPFNNDDLSNLVLATLKDLTKKNLNWNYQFGPELYQDMKHINGGYAMDRARYYMHNAPEKKNILWDTKGMYNDMLNDNTTDYWCFRNKVKKTKIFSVSGKCNCLGCNEQIIGLSKYEERYNERYGNVDHVMCYSCEKDNSIKCDCCGCYSPTADYKKVNETNINISNICKKCADKYLRVCPCCGELFLTYDFHNSNDFKIIKDFEILDTISFIVYNQGTIDEKLVLPRSNFYLRDFEDEKEVLDKTDDKVLFYNVYICDQCKEVFYKKHKNNLKEINVQTFYFGSDKGYKPVYLIDWEHGKDYYFNNLKKFNLSSGEITAGIVFPPKTKE